MTLKTKERLIFWIRLLSWILIGCVLPIAVFAVKFGLFTVSNVTYDELGNAIYTPDVSINGWGIISCLIVGAFATSVFKELSQVGTGYSLLKQCCNGIRKTIPFAICFAICYFLQNALSQVTFCLGVYLLCSLAAVPLNPLPKWRFEKNGSEDYGTLTDVVTKTVKKVFEKEGSE